ncbi:MAG: AmmeMemoRadiSam system protein B [Fervidobacterium sp.]
MDRKPVVAGKFYPGTPVQLEKTCEAFINEKAANKYFEHPVGLILPHAGYVYSGKTAGLGIKKAAYFGKPKNIIILGPNHTGYGELIAVWKEGTWQTPLGSLQVNSEMTNKLIDNYLIFEDEMAHIYEHSIEVQLPLLQYAFGDFKIVPICMKDQRLSTVLKIAEKIKEMLKEYPETLVVASSDFNHYDPHEITIKKDEQAIEKILNADLEGLYDSIKIYNITMCGPGPVAVVRSIFDNINLIYHTTSAEFSQDYSYTVGYASFILY